MSELNTKADLTSHLTYPPDALGPTDPDLIQRVQHQDADALSMLYDRYSKNVYAIALFITREAFLAQEATQNTFMKLWTRAEQYQDRQNHFRSWLLMVTRNCAIDLLRRERHRPQSTLSLDEDNLDQIKDMHDEEEGRWREMQHLLDHLPPPQRQVIILSFYRGLSLKDIAEHLNVPLPTIKTRAKLGLTKLRQAFHQT